MRNQLVVLAAIGAGLSVPVPADAEERLDQIIVTGARAPIPVSDIGSAVTVIARDEIERRQARYVTDLLRAVPGFAVSHTGVVGSQTQVRVRGSEANHVLVLVDGVRANDPATGDEFRWEYLTTANIERIEIVRGPQSALWGSDAIGGVVHIITRAEHTGFGGNAYLESGTENTRNGALHSHYGGERWSLGLGLEQLVTDGFNISRNGDEADDADVSTASLSATFDPSENVGLRFSARAVDAYTQFDAVDFIATGLPADSDVATDTTQAIVRLGASVGPADARVRHHLNAHYFESDNDNLIDGLEDSSTTSNRMTWGYQADIALGRNRLSLGLEHEETEFSQRGAIDFGDPNQDQAIAVTSVIADFQARTGDAVTWLASARFDDHSDFDNAVTGRLSVAWELSEASVVRANVGTGQKTPTFVERFGYFPESFVGNESLQPERSTSYDLGVARRFGSLTAELSVFRQDLNDEINGFYCPNPWPASCTAINMDGESKRSGVEVSARWDAGERLSLATTYSYTHADGADSATELRRPRHAGSVHIDYDFPDQRAQFSLAADYGGSRKDVFFPPWPAPSQIVALQNYWLVDIAVQYRVTAAISLFGRASNVLDTDYEQVFGYRTPGRALHAGVRVDFSR
jgi:vitamin B12 transporter